MKKFTELCESILNEVVGKTFDNIKFKEFIEEILLDTKSAWAGKWADQKSKGLNIYVNLLKNTKSNKNDVTKAIEKFLEKAKIDFSIENINKDVDDYDDISFSIKISTTDNVNVKNEKKLSKAEREEWHQVDKNDYYNIGVGSMGGEGKAVIVNKQPAVWVNEKYTLEVIKVDKESSLFDTSAKYAILLTYADIGKSADGLFETEEKALAKAKELMNDNTLIIKALRSKKI